MATRLKKMQLTSVDLVRAGANQEADICLFKSAAPEDAPTEQETNIFKQFINWLRGNNHEAPAEPVEKDYITFDQINDSRESSELLWRYSDALNKSIRSIQDDRDLDGEEKADMMKQSLQQFNSAMEKLIGNLAGIKSAPDYDEIQELN